MPQNLNELVASRNMTYHIETYGCQMNSHESEKLSGVLLSLGLNPAPEKTTADLVIFNTCCVREHAEARLYGNVGALKAHKENVPGAVIAVSGCMMQQEGAAQKLMRRFPFVDMAFGTNHIHYMEQMLQSVLLDGQRVIRADEDETIVEGLPVSRQNASSAFVNVIYGCNNFCTYCIVPYVRGRERSRSEDEIVAEIDALCKQGVKEITLLGQNVNSYGKERPDGGTFAQLLARIDDETDIARLRFMTSHPKDLTEELIDCYGRLNSLCEHIHLPVQSGSDRILGLMNRRYTRAHYLDLIARLRQRVPNIAATTDIIVGFPGETEADFEDTLSLVAQVGFDAAYTFAYSPRAGTKAADMSGQIAAADKSERLARLNAQVLQGIKRRSQSYMGQRVQVLADSVSKYGGEISGKTRTAKTVNFSGSEEEIGRLIDVNVDRVNIHTLHGVRAEETSDVSG